MAQTENIGLNIISTTDDMSVSEFFQLLAGAGANSNMVILDNKIKELIDSIRNINAGDMQSSDYDPTSEVMEAGGIVGYVAANGGKEEIFLTTITYDSTSSTYTPNHTYEEIKSAMANNQVCVCKYNGALYLLAATQTAYSTNGTTTYSYIFCNGPTSSGFAKLVTISDSNVVTIEQTNFISNSNLSSSINSTSTTTAANSYAVKQVSDKVDALPTMEESEVTSYTCTAKDAYYLTPNSAVMYVRQVGKIAVLTGRIEFTANTTAIMCEIKFGGTYSIPRPATGLGYYPIHIMSYPIGELLDGNVRISSSNSSEASCEISIYAKNGFSNGGSLLFSFAYAI